MGNLQIPRASEGNELGFQFQKTFDLRTLENQIENDNPFHSVACALITSDLDGSIVAMNSKFAKEYGFSSSSEAMIDIQHFARSSTPLMGKDVTKKQCFYPEKQRFSQDKTSEDYALEQANRLLQSQSGHTAFNWQIKDKHGKFKDETVFATAFDFENWAAFLLMFMPKFEENCDKECEQKLIEKYKGSCLPCRVFDMEFQKSVEHFKPIYSGFFGFSRSDPAKKENWEESFCRIDGTGMKLSLYKNLTDNIPFQVLSLNRFTEIVKTQELSTSTFAQQAPNLLQIKGTNQMDVFVSDKDSLAMETFQFALIKSISDQKSNMNCSIAELTSQHIDNVRKFEWLPSFEMYYDNHVINTDNMKEIRVGKRDTRKMIQEMENYEWLGGKEKARAVGRILIDEVRRISVVEWSFRYRHKKADAVQAEMTKKRKKHCLIVSKWNKLGKIIREDVFFATSIRKSHVPDMDELALHAVQTEKEMLDESFVSTFKKGPHKFYESRREVEELSSRPVVQESIKLICEEQNMQKWIDSCCDQSMQFTGSDREENYIGFENYAKHKLLTKTTGKSELLLSIVEGPLALLQVRMNMKVEGENEFKDRVVGMLFVIRDRKIRRIDSFYD